MFVISCKPVRSFDGASAWKEIHRLREVAHGQATCSAGWSVVHAFRDRPEASVSSHERAQTWMQAVLDLEKLLAALDAEATTDARATELVLEARGINEVAAGGKGPSA